MRLIETQAMLMLFWQQGLDLGRLETAYWAAHRRTIAQNDRIMVWMWLTFVSHHVNVGSRLRAGTPLA